jgi:hypothetical protein
LAFKLILSATRKWRKLDGSNQLAELIKGVPSKGGIKLTKHAPEITVTNFRASRDAKFKGF